MGTHFDWQNHVPASYTTQTTDDRLIVDYTRDTIELIRCPHTYDVYWMLGLYQAEGAKKSVLAWSIVSSTPALLRAAVITLEALGLTRDRMWMQIRHAPGDDSRAARAEFEIKGIDVRSTLPRTPHRRAPRGQRWKTAGKRGAVLHVARSAAFYRMVMSALDQIHAPGYAFPSKQAARAYALGWLDGDGGVHKGATMSTLDFFGTPEEIVRVVEALTVTFAWRTKKTDVKEFQTRRSLDCLEHLQLAAAGAFRFSRNRARLLYGALRAIDRTQNVYAAGDRSFSYHEAKALLGCSVSSMLAPGVMHIVAKGQYALTDGMKRAHAIATALNDEIAALREIIPIRALGGNHGKCAPYPVQLVPYAIAAFEKEKARSD